MQRVSRGNKDVSQRARELATAQCALPCHAPLAARVYRACVIVPTVHYSAASQEEDAIAVMLL